MTTYKVKTPSGWTYIDNQNYDARYILASTKGSNNGVASLDESGHVIFDQLPSSITGAVNYRGTFDPATGVAPTPAAAGYYYVSSGAGTVSATSFSTGDWLVYTDGSSWNKIANSSASVTWNNVSDRPASYTPDTHSNDAHSEVYITALGVTYEALVNNNDVGDSANQVASGVHTHSGYQPLDGDLTAIAGLSGTAGLIRKTATNTYQLDTNNYLTELTTATNSTLWDSQALPSLTGNALKVMRLNAAGTALEFATNTAAITTFLELTDTPSSYVDQGGKIVKVNSGGTALEFATESGGGTWGSITGTLSEQTDLQTVLDAKLEASDLSDVGYSSVATTVTLPASPTTGDIYEFIGTGANWTITANTGQYIRMLSTISAAAGTIASTSGHDCVCLIYIGSNVWLVKSAMGILEVT